MTHETEAKYLDHIMQTQRMILGEETDERIKWLEDFGKKIEASSERFEKKHHAAVRKINKAWNRYLKRDYKRRQSWAA